MQIPLYQIIRIRNIF